ncbi:ribosomal-protein-alanine N-acetyltransferase [Lacinutrix venerupis]|uniref:GNAT family N-acetyltransferase n=1 Tax=Lacinutrix venerupis TaxID=1486034 RepID=UPI000EB1BBD5|nr:GNAT family N-acetyltransferase [Lacinutrix venerupis]RLJ63437.1 ribosomal-protein-alanine N-acetyltransferase [Lacinutrix venerupis]
MIINIETKRLILRDIRTEDLNGMFELDSNPNVHKYLGNNPVKTKSESLKYIEKKTKQFIGWSGIKFNTGPKEALGSKTDFYDIGYRFIERYWNKGYATETAIVALDYGFKELKLKTIVGAAEIGNIASNRILEKIGLKYKEQFPFENELINWYELNTEDYAKKMS